VPEKLVTKRDYQPGPAKDDRRGRIDVWQDRIRDPSLTVLLVLQVCGLFVAVPLAARGVHFARMIAGTLLLVALGIVVMLSQRRGAIVAILAGFMAMAAAELFGADWSPMARAVVGRSGNILTWLALTWVVAHAVYAPGRITSHRLQGAAVVYLSIAMIFAAAYGLILELQPDAFANLTGSRSEASETAALQYFSLTTLTTVGYGDILPVDPFARSLANLESVLGVFYLSITVARLVTLELQDRRR
jgi:hypothetical protein